MKKLLLLLNLSILSIYLYGQVTRTANVATPGTLASVASSYLATVTNLTVTGSIDARDFVTMRDKMTSLTTIDLSSVVINSYIDAGGNLGLGNNWEYKANGIPDFAFVTPLYKAKTILKKIVLPSNSTSIGESAFDGCTGLQNVITGSAMSIISSYAFYDCSGLTSFNINAIIPPSLGIKVFENSNYTSCILTVPLGSVSIYKLVD